ncbi:MAG: phosphoribosylaminoimidazolesuccinocarboxamide synthase, partial [Actinomycetota bacterium]|nr:phosphoribosylaminoimidazolesuccinocarboxamide synthase [Actinomycetota bacterium]
MSELELLHSGKVRDMYVVDDQHLLMVASDRISAFDVVFNEPIPDKGRVLTAMTVWWSEYLASIASTHLVSADPTDFPEVARRPEWEGRALLVRRAEMLPLECIVRGYITGSAWKEYQESGTMHGSTLPAGLLEAQQLPQPVFTPS